MSPVVGWEVADRVVVGRVAAAGRDWQANTAPEDSADPGRIAIHNTVVVGPVFPAEARAAVVLRFPNSRSVNSLSLNLSVQHIIVEQF